MLWIKSDKSNKSKISTTESKLISAIGKGSFFVDGSSQLINRKLNIAIEFNNLIL